MLCHAVLCAGRSKRRRGYAAAGLPPGAGAEAARAVGYGECQLLVSPDAQPPTLSHFIGPDGIDAASGPRAVQPTLCADCDLLAGVFATDACAFVVTISSSAVTATVLLDGIPSRGRAPARGASYFVFDPPAGREVPVVLTPPAAGVPQL